MARRGPPKLEEGGIHMTKAQSVPSRLSETITARMKEKGVSIRDLSDAIDTVYEHTRRIVRGEALPSTLRLRVICDVLNLPYKELLQSMHEAKIRETSGDLLLAMAGKKPGMEELERVWDLLTPVQQQDITGIAQAWAKRSRATGYKVREHGGSEP
jgi:transcriptional regulator with XRE-family HTH domain